MTKTFNPLTKSEIKEANNLIKLAVKADAAGYEKLASLYRTYKMIAARDERMFAV